MRESQTGWFSLLSFTHSWDVNLLWNLVKSHALSIHVSWETSVSQGHWFQDLTTTGDVRGFPGGSEGKKKKNLPAMQVTQVRSLGLEIPWRREWQPTPIFLPGEFHGQWSLVGYNLKHHKDSDISEQLTTCTWHLIRLKYFWCLWSTRPLYVVEMFASRQFLELFE